MKKVLVTGGNKGIGYAVCETLLRDFPDVAVLLGSRDAARGRAAVEKLRAASGGGDGGGRVQLLVIDTSSSESVDKAAESVEGRSLYGVVNNAGIGFGETQKATLATNYWGVRSVTEAFLPKLQPDGGRIVNVSSASGPYFLMDLKKKGDPLYTKLDQPWTISGGLDELDEIARTYKVADEGKKSWDSYGLSKALVNAYTYLVSRSNPNLVVNAVTPGFVKTDLTATLGATKTPSEGAAPIAYCLMDDEVAKKPHQGRFYGSDCKRSPFGVYRDPNDPEYDGPDGP